MKRNAIPRLVFADCSGKVYDAPVWASAQKAGYFFPLRVSDLVPLSSSSDLFLLPDRAPVGYDPQDKQFFTVDRNPYGGKNGGIFAVAAFLTPGFTAIYSTAYREITTEARTLPLFAYAPCAFYRGRFYAAAIRVDRSPRHEFHLSDINRIKLGVRAYRKKFPGNRLCRHLECCALTNNCPAAKNFFMNRYEAPLPTSPACNARCLGCLSLQPEGEISVTQERLKFRPLAHEIAELAIHHLTTVEDPVVSFGQGCEGEPLLVAPEIEKAIRIIRQKTSRGIINLNTNASRPDYFEKLVRAGLDSVRVSLNSVQPVYYGRYYRPRGYSFEDVLESLKIAARRKVFISINYLVMPGFSDDRTEAAAFMNFLKKVPVNMIQWRNMNFDPVRYFKRLDMHAAPERMIGMDTLLRQVHKKFPKILFGYFNPGRKKMSR